MSTLLYVENPIVLSEETTTPTVSGIKKQYGVFDRYSTETSTTKFFRFDTIYNDDYPRQLWEYKFKINSSKITSSHVGSIIDYCDWWYIPQILINTDGDLVIYIEYPIVQVIDPLTGLPLWMDPTTDQPTTTPQYTLDGSLNMSALITTNGQYAKYKVTLTKDKYYTLKMLFDHNTHCITVILNNRAIATQPIKYNSHIFAYQFKNCEFLDMDYFKLINLDDNNSSGSSTPEVFNVITTIANKLETAIEKDVM